ncbi:MAG: N-(5-phosphoribosyl)anthranilate isomerase [Herbinix sp.]|jgi:phosphoribosylanthranilate isomerase|nr:N-(5-phosphoribosyl)anthranilate isomerase [Herbinix sp.]
MTKIKICGISRKVDVFAVNEALPDYVGFVFASSRRQVSEETAMELKEILHPGILTIGVFVNEEIDRISRLCDRGIIDLVQLHGDESEAYIHELRTFITNPIIKALRVSVNMGLKEEASNIPCDYLLLDTYHKDQFGGTGERFDWDIIPKLDRPYFLAGGIGFDNVSEAITRLRPYCVDVSSSVETEGYKDADKIIDIVKLVRSVIE